MGFVPNKMLIMARDPGLAGSILAKGAAHVRGEQVGRLPVLRCAFGEPCFEDMWCGAEMSLSFEQQPWLHSQDVTLDLHFERLEVIIALCFHPCPSRQMVTHADGYAERDAALLVLAEKQEGRSRRITVGAHKAYDRKDFVSTVRELNVTQHVIKNDKGRTSNLDRRTTRQPGYAISLSRRWLVEEGFGWLKQTGPLRQVKLRGLEKVDWLFVFSCAAHNLIRMPRLVAQAPEMLREMCARAPGASLGDDSLRPTNPYKHRPEPYLKQISNGKK
jgi:hypothetical protein